jgi:hypothetical protein
VISLSLNDNKIKKYRTEGTAKMILELIRGLDLASLLSDIFIYTDNPIAKDLIKRYEWQLIGAIEEPEKFEKGLHLFYQETARHIKKQQLFKEFYSFCYFVFSTFSSRQEDRKDDEKYHRALHCYYNILFQQMNYFAPHPKIVYGLDSNGKLMLRTEPFPNLDVAMMSLYDRKKPLTKEAVFKNFKKYGYNIQSETDFHLYHSNDQLITNMILVMAYFINENTIQINPKEYYWLAKGMKLPNVKNSTSIYKNLLREKRYFLPMNGVKGIYKNCGEIQEVFYQEVFTENRIILLYKVTATDGKEFCGFYDNKLELFYSPWLDTNLGDIFHQKIENFILENYCYLTTDIEERMKELNLEKRLYFHHETPVISIQPLPSVQFVYEVKDNKEKPTKKKTDTFRIFDKRKYQETTVKVHPFIRKLPPGAKASEEAIALAKEYHYVLREGETFVRPFERKAYRRKK